MKCTYCGRDDGAHDAGCVYAPGYTIAALRDYVVLHYHFEYNHGNEPLESAVEAFLCTAVDTDHALEQCENTYPESCIRGVYVSAS